MSKKGHNTVNQNIHELTEFQYSIMFVLADNPQYGLGVKRELQQYYGGEINHGRLYPNLDNLIEMDLLRKDKRDNRTNEYILTDRGLSYALGRIEWELNQLLGDSQLTQELLQTIEEHAIPR